MNGCSCVLIKLYFLKQATSQVSPVVCGLTTPEWLHEAWGSGWVCSTERSRGENGMHTDPGKKAFVALEHVSVTGTQIKLEKVV